MASNRIRGLTTGTRERNVPTHATQNSRGPATASRVVVLQTRSPTPATTNTLLRRLVLVGLLGGGTRVARVVRPPGAVRDGGQVREISDRLAKLLVRVLRLGGRVGKPTIGESA